MSNKKSLGSSPIGFSSMGESSFNFIPDRQLNSSATAVEDPVETEKRYPGNGHTGNSQHRAESEKENKKPEDSPNKKIVSYYLEEDLIDRLKRMADEEGMFYSTLVSKALRYWINRFGD